MRRNGQLIIGSLILFWGLALLIGEIFQIDFWVLCWPTALILIGVWMLVRPRFSLGGLPVNIEIFGPIKRSGTWQVKGEEFWIIIGDIKLDLTQAELPSGETAFRAFGFIGDVDLRIPQGIGLSISSMGLVSDTKILGQKQDHVFFPVYFTSPGYAEAERKVRLECYFFIADIDVK